MKMQMRTKMKMWTKMKMQINAQKRNECSTATTSGKGLILVKYTAFSTIGKSYNLTKLLCRFQKEILHIISMNSNNFVQLQAILCCLLL